MDLSAFAGTWVNTNSGPRQVDKILLRPQGENLFVHVYGSSHPAPKAWGETSAESIYADGLNSSRGMAFLASYKFPEMNVNLGVNLNQGLLVMALFTSFEGNGQSNYFAREFFCQ